MSGGYSILVLVFLCKAEGKLISNPKENEMLQWRDVREVERELEKYPERFYPMHLLSLKKYFLQLKQSCLQ